MSYSKSQNYRKKQIENTKTIYGQKWYYRLVPSKDKNNTRSLVEDHAELNQHLIVCLIPDTLPGSKNLFRTKDGRHIHLFSYFDSYIDYYSYKEKDNTN